MTEVTDDPPRLYGDEVRVVGPIRRCIRWTTHEELTELGVRLVVTWQLVGSLW